MATLYIGKGEAFTVPQALFGYMRRAAELAKAGNLESQEFKETALKAWEMMHAAGMSYRQMWTAYRHRHCVQQPLYDRMAWAIDLHDQECDGG